MAKTGIRKTIERVTRNQRNAVENRMHYQSGSSWKVIQSDAAVNNRRQSIARSVPEVDFVPGIMHSGHPVDGLEAGKTCSC